MLPSLVEHPNLYFETVAIYALVRYEGDRRRSYPQDEDLLTLTVLSWHADGRILKDPRTRPHIKTTTQAIMFICKNVGIRLKPFLGVITQSFIQTIRRVNSELR